MLCERCQSSEATVYLTTVLWPSSEPTQQSLCESCYPELEAERVRSYNPARDSVPVSSEEVENMTAAEYLEAAWRATRNGVDKPRFSQISDHLLRLPKTQRRLVFEMFSIVWQSLEQGHEPGPEGLFLVTWKEAVEPDRVQDYVGWIERIVNRCFQLRAQLPDARGEHGPFALTLSVMLTALGTADRERFKAVLEQLKRKIGEGNTDPRWAVIAKAEEMIREQ